MRITVSYVRECIGIQIIYNLLIRPAVNDDNAKSFAMNAAYSELFKVVGILLRDELTKGKCL